MDESDFFLSVSLIVSVGLLIFVVLGLSVLHMARSDRRQREVRRMHRAPPQSGH